MDLVAGCRAFVGVGERGSFTLGAAAAGIPQPVASRRVAALERHLGGALFERTGRGAVLTAFGRELLPSARRLVDLAEAVEVDVDRARRRPFRLAVPLGLSTAELGRLVADARRVGTALEPVGSASADRLELVRRAEVRAALRAVPGDQADWVVPLGLAGTEQPGGSVLHLETLRPTRGGRRAPVLRLGPEDDVPQLRDALVRAATASALGPGQVVVAPSPGVAVAEVLLGPDLLLCSHHEAVGLGLEWRRVGGLDLVRGHRVEAGLPEDAERLRGPLGPAVARCLGAVRGPAGCLHAVRSSAT